MDNNVKNALIDPVTLIFDPSTPKHFFSLLLGYPKIPLPSLNTLISFVIELRCGQTDRQTNGLAGTSYPYARPTEWACMDKELCVVNMYAV